MGVGSGGVDFVPPDGAPGATVREAMIVDHDQRPSSEGSLEVEDTWRPKDQEIDHEGADSVRRNRSHPTANDEDAEEQTPRQRATPVRSNDDFILADRVVAWGGV